jgi:hypothetical protein
MQMLSFTKRSVVDILRFVKRFFPHPRLIIQKVPQFQVSRLKLYVCTFHVAHQRYSDSRQGFVLWVRWRVTNSVAPEPEGSQQPPTSLYSEPIESNPHLRTQSPQDPFWSHLRLGLPSGPFPSCFPNKTLYTFRTSPVSQLRGGVKMPRAKCP